MAYSVSTKKAIKKREEEKAKEAARKAMFRRRETYWKPKNGDNRFRLLPPWTDKGPNGEQFWREIFMHFGVTDFTAPDPDNTFSVPCPKETPGAALALGLEEGAKITCPICEAISKLRQSDDPADIEMAKQSRAKSRVYSNVIDLNDPTWTQNAIDALKANNTPDEHLPKLGDPKVQVYTYGPTIMNMILDFFQDGIDLSDPDEGYDLILTREGEGIKTKYRLRPEMKASKAPITDAQLDKHLEDLDKLMPYLSTEQMDLVLQGATAQDVYALSQSADEDEALSTSEETESAGELPPHDENEESGSEDDEAAGDANFPPMDDEGDVDYERLTDEQIEDPDNEQYEGVYISCYGIARQLNINDVDCKDECGLFERCVARNEQLDEIEAAKKKGVGKKKAGKGKKSAGKKAGKDNGTSAKVKHKSTEPSGTGDDDLEAEMRAALGK